MASTISTLAETEDDEIDRMLANQPGFRPATEVFCVINMFSYPTYCSALIETLDVYESFMTGDGFGISNIELPGKLMYLDKDEFYNGEMDFKGSGFQNAAEFEFTRDGTWIGRATATGLAPLFTWGAQNFEGKCTWRRIDGPGRHGKSLLPSYRKGLHEMIQQGPGYFT